MVHLWIVVPHYQSEHTLDLLRHTSSVCNLIFLERAAQKPEGDVILCDVTREDVSVLISDLRELNIDVEGSIAMELVDSQVSQAAIEAEKASSGMPSDAVVWEEVESRTSENIELSTSFLAFMILAMLIAAVGIFTNQLPLIVGAMIVGPEFGPIAGLCVAAVQRRRDLARRSLRALAIGFPVGIVATFVFTLILRGVGAVDAGSDSTHHSFTAFIAEPNGWSFLVAYLAGTAGVLSLTSAKSGALVGVLISVTTIPAAANIGVAAALGDWSTCGGAGRQLLVNFCAILLAGIGTLYVQRRLYLTRRRAHLHDEAREVAGLPVGRSRRAGSATNEKPVARG
jgi:uncharacterized hydrophobic protein (TIGR00271 family)